MIIHNTKMEARPSTQLALIFNTIISTHSTLFIKYHSASSGGFCS